MKLHVNLILIFVFLLRSGAYGQTPLWGHGIGSGSVDAGQACKIMHSGNVLMAGKFSGTVDIDPGPAVYNITSNGLTDVFLACYTPAGSFLWGFGVGGTGYDGALNITTDLSDNVIVAGFFQSNVDFDPGPGTTIIPFVGGTSVSWEGDGFVAKFSSTGAFQWARGLGGPLTWDRTGDVGTDDAGNIYAGGCFNGSLVVAGGPTFSVTAAGEAYLIKYSPSGAVIWAHQYGQVGTATQDCGVFSLAVRGSNVYVCGWFKNTADFSPWSTPTILSASGPSDYNGYLAKYDLSGNCMFAVQVAGAGSDPATALALDAAENVYLTGVTTSASLLFGPGSPLVPCPGGGGNNDIFLAKYTSSGTLVWGRVIGGTGDDEGLAVDINSGYLYTSGHMAGTVDFDPSGSVANLVSAGGRDGYLAKYDLSGNYICGFRYGAPSTDDIGNGLTHDPAGYEYATGEFGGVATDFDPGSGVFPLTSSGSTDAFLVKYNYIGGSAYTGTLVGDTICAGNTVYLSLTMAGGPAGPYTITFTDGVSSFTLSGILPGVPFALTPSPMVTTTYTVTATVATGGTALCNPPSVAIAPVTVLVTSVPAITPAYDVSCNTATFTAASGAVSYNWTFGDGSSASGSTVSHIYAAAGTYSVILSVTYGSGCIAVDTVTIVTTGAPAVNLGADISACAGSLSGLLHSSVTYIAPVYLWSTGATTSSITGSSPGTYWLQVTDGVCSGADTIVLTERPIPVVGLGPDLAICDGSNITLQSSGIYISPIYLWNTGSTASSITTGAGTYELSVTVNGCTGTDTVQVVSRPVPEVNLPGSASICSGLAITIGAAQTAGASDLWSTGSTDSAITVTTGGTYTLTVTKDGCSKTAAIAVVEMGPPPSIHLGPDTVLCNGEELTLRVSDSSARWNNGNPGQTLTIINSGTYWATVTNQCGSVTDTMHVEYAPCNIWFPDAFTPNGDGKNDIARVAGLLGYYTDYRLSIYNRFGERVFYTEDIYSGWDGIYKSVKQDLGTYFYMIFYKLHGKEYMMKGDLLLIR